MLPSSRSRSGPNESPVGSRTRPSTPSSGHRPSTPSSGYRPSTPGGTRRGTTAGTGTGTGGGTPSTPRGSRGNTGGPFRSEPNSPPAAAAARPRLSFDRSPRSADAKPVAERRVPKIGTPPPDQKQLRREIELQSRLESAHEDLKKAKDQLSFVVGEKDRLVGELNEAKRVADEIHEKLQDALMAKRWAEEATEIEKFRADELEQAGIDESQKRDEEWQREVESVRSQHAADLETLVTTTEELERFRRELSMANEAKKAALGHADDAMKIAEVNADKVEILSGEVTRLKGLLDSSAAVEESKNREREEFVKNLESEISVLKGKLEEARVLEERLADMEKLTEELKTQLADAKKAQSEVHQQFEEWKNKAGSLEMELEEATLSEKAKSDTLISTEEELDKTLSILQDRESEMEVLKGKTTALEIEVARLSTEINESSENLDASQQELFGLQTTIDVLKNKLEAAEEVASEALNNEKTANANIVSLTEEKIKLINELNDARDREEKERKSVEDLTAALSEASGKAEEAHERFLKKEDDYEHALAQIGDLKMSLNSTKENYEVMIEEAHYDITCLRNTVGRLEAEVSKYREECEAKELEIVRSNKQSEEEIAALKAEADRVGASLRDAEHELQTVNEEKEILQEKLLYTESAVVEANRAVQDVKAEKEGLQEQLMHSESAVAEANKAMQEVKAEKEDLQAQLMHTESAVAEANKALQEVKAEKEDLQEQLMHTESTVAEANKAVQEVKAEKDDLQEKFLYTESAVAEANKAVQEVKAEKEGLQEQLAHMESAVAEANKAAQEAMSESLQLKDRLLDKENALQSLTQENDEFRLREADAMKKIEELSALLAEAMEKKHPEEEEKLVVVDEVHSSAREVAETAAETEDTEGESDKKPSMELIVANGNSNGDMNQGEEKHDSKVEQQEAKGDFTTIHESDKVVEKQLQADVKQETESSKDDLSSKEDSSTEHANGTAASAEVTSKVAMSPTTTTKPQKKNKPLLKKFGNLLKKKNSK
ncbi:WEB family protein At5g16730, chloroplastic-like isoform X2 [Triticum dicoccoides]|uniref:WEB family protein At5g16730, chloroplastic-like isoform X2 n=1 Tax=Triticum dicoccoides TaxID=85692 RepID=UPI00188E034C|nr:WEB family protein At5g16730, chloroplastic-like isoform X2 [Triticum dicoccoides]